MTYSNEGDISVLMSRGMSVLVQLRACGFPDRLTSAVSLRSFLTSVDSNSRFKMTLLSHQRNKSNVMYSTQSRVYSVFLL